jgi:hypothetical protein
MIMNTAEEPTVPTIAREKTQYFQSPPEARVVDKTEPLLL